MREDGLGTREAAEALGVSRNTLLRWLREGRVSEPERDFRGWRVFHAEDLERIRDELEAGAVGAGPPSAPPPPPPAPKASRRSAAPTTAPARRPRRPISERSSPPTRVEFLRQVPVFSSLTSADLAALDAVAQYRGFPRGSTLFHEGQRVHGLHVLLKGRIKLVRLSSEGREQILEIVEPVSTFAETALFDASQRYATLGRSSTVASVLTIPKAPLERLMASRPALARAFLFAFAERMKALMRKVEEATFLTVDERFARYVKEHSRGGALETLNVAEVAAIIGAARESVSRALGRLSKSGIVHIHRGRLIIDDPARLDQIG